MKALSIAVVLTAVVALSGCCNWRGRSCPVKPCLNNPCAVSGNCAPACAPAPMMPPPMRQLEK